MLTTIKFCNLNLHLLRTICAVQFRDFDLISNINTRSFLLQLSQIYTHTQVTSGFVPLLMKLFGYAYTRPNSTNRFSLTFIPSLFIGKA